MKRITAISATLAIGLALGGSPSAQASLPTGGQCSTTTSPNGAIAGICVYHWGGRFHSGFGVHDQD